MSKLVWYRNNLRTIDCEPLLSACHRDENVHACFLFACTQWKNHGWGPNRVEYTRRCVVDLANRLTDLNIPFHVFQTPSFAKAPGVVHALAKELGCSEVHWSREYEVNELARDMDARRLLLEAGVKVVEHDDDVVIQPDQLRTRAGGPFKVFTPYKRTWAKALEDRMAGIQRVQPRPRKAERPQLPDIPKVLNGFEDFVQLDDFPSGEVRALIRLDTFIGERSDGYADDRNIPSIDGTSRLSPCLAAGVLSPRTCVAAASSHAQADSTGLETWISELAWRDFYRAVLLNFPDVCRGQPFKLETEAIAWRDDPVGFQAWCSGQTGYPIVDAAMRALVQTGWMHNRLRMVTSQFLSKHLLLDWRKGEAFFAHHLVDIDFASNNGGWQWSSSTGTDAAPYFRVFNPTTQGRRFDPEGIFIKRYVPELAHVDAAGIHEPANLPALERSAFEYPDPIVEQSHGRTRAIAAFADASSRLSHR